MKLGRLATPARFIFIMSVWKEFNYRVKLSPFQPPISVDEFNINNQKPAIIVEGDVMLKEYQFIVDKLLKIGRVKN